MPPQGAGLPCTPSPRVTGGAGAERGVEEVLALVDEAERAYLAGDMAAFALAADAVVATLGASADEEERRAAFEAAARLFAWAQPQGPLASLSALAGQAGEAQPWAQRALAVAHASAERYADAAAVASLLTGGEPGSEHALFGLALAVRVAVEDGDEAEALVALDALVAAFPDADETALMAALVPGAFPETGGSGPRLPGGTVAAAAGAPAVMAAASVAGAARFEVEAVRPNPAATEAVLPFQLGAEAEVEVSLYDVLGRRVAVIASGHYGAGRHAVQADVAGLAPGIYVVRAEARLPGGAIEVAARRLTLAR